MSSSVVRLRELRVKDQVSPIGYRASVLASTPTRRSFMKKFDFPPEFLNTICVSLSNSLVRMDAPLYGMISDGEFFTVDEADTTCIESYEQWFDCMERYIDLRDYVDLDTLATTRYFICRQMLYDINVPVGNVTEVSSSANMHSSWGMCFKPRTSPTRFRISLAERLLKVGDFDGIDLVMLHELLHTCPGCFNHGATWKYWASEVCSAYGYSITRLTDAETVHVDANELLSMGYFGCQCQDCGQIITKKTECEFILHPNRWRCNCGGKFVRIQ